MIRSRSRSRRSGSVCSGSACLRIRLRTFWIDPADPCQHAVVGDQHRADREQRHEHRDPDGGRLEQVAADAAAQDRGHREHRHREQGREHEQVARRQARDRPSLRQAGLDQHPVLERRADGAAAGGDLRQRVARELRRDHGGDSRAAHREVLQRPQARQRGDLQREHEREPGGRQLVEVVPGAEHVDQARSHEVERDPGDREPEHGADDPLPRGRRRLAALDLVLGVGALLDRALEPVADLGHRRPEYESRG